MTDQGLLNYIRRHREVGKSDDEIRASLAKGNWTEKDINDALSAATAVPVSENLIAPVTEPETTIVSTKTLQNIQLAVVVVILLAGVYLHAEHKKKERMYLELAEAYFCSFMDAVSKNGKMFKSTKTEDVTMKQFAEFTEPIIGGMAVVQSQYKLDDNELRKAMEVVKERMNETKFKQTVADNLRQRISKNGTCTAVTTTG